MIHLHVVCCSPVIAMNEQRVKKCTFLLHSSTAVGISSVESAFVVFVVVNSMVF